MDNNTKRIVEIEGIKVEVDLRTAKRVDELRIGSKVKVLITTSYGGPQVWPGVVVGFEPFQKLPTIVIAYIESQYSKAELKFLHYNAKSKEGHEIVAAADDVLDLDREMIFAHFAREIATKEKEIEIVKERRAYFERHFQQYWSQVEPRPDPETIPPAPAPADPF